MSTVSDRAALVVLAVALSLALVPVGVGSATSVGQQSAASVDDRSSIVPEELPDADATVTRIEIDENGTAYWSVTIRTRLENESDVEDYEVFQERFRADREAHVKRFERRMTGVVSSASEATGRSMNASAFRARTSIQELPRRWGTVTFSFRWTSFAAVDGDAIAVGDVFEGGLFLDDGDYLEVVPPAAYAPTTSPPPDETEGTTVVWSGPEEFADRQPAVRFEPTGSATASDTTGADTDSGRVIGTADVAVAISALVITGIAIAVATDRERRHRLRSRIPLPGEPADDRTDEASAENEDPSTAAVDAASDRVDPDRATAAAGPDLDPDLVTDEGRVRRLLERNGGRMRQAAIAEELEWSASKTSRVVSDMAADETVEKLRIGRENVIDLLEESD